MAALDGDEDGWEIRVARHHAREAALRAGLGEQRLADALALRVGRTVWRGEMAAERLMRGPVGIREGGGVGEREHGGERGRGEEDTLWAERRG